MTEYIERDSFLDSKRHLYCENCARRKNEKGKIVYEIGDAPCRSCGIWDVLDDMEDFPVADVRPVVLCRDCRSYNKPRLGFCETHLVRMHGNDYCSYGKKREES